MHFKKQSVLQEPFIFKSCSIWKSVRLKTIQVRASLMKHIYLPIFMLWCLKPPARSFSTKRRFQRQHDLPNRLHRKPSNLDVGQKCNQQSQTDLMSSGATEANGMVAILGSMQYTLANHKQIFLGHPQRRHHYRYVKYLKLAIGSNFGERAIDAIYQRRSLARCGWPLCCWTRKEKKPT